MDDTKPKAFVFVLMPFSESFSDIYELGIKAACTNAGAYCERVDEQIFDEGIVQRIYNQIYKADIIVADMTGRNPNVFYEVGYAHALNKRVILLTQNSEDIPFDLKNYPHIIYGGKIVRLKEDIEKRIIWCINNPKESLAIADILLTFWCNGTKIGEGDNVIANWYSDGSRIEFNLDINNPSSHIIHSDAIRISLITPGDIYPDFCQISGAASSAELPDGRQITNLKPSHDIFAEGWESIKVLFWDRKGHTDSYSFDMIVRLFTDVGHIDFNNKIVVPSPEK